MAAALLAAGAARATDCTVAHYVWDLELDTLEKLAGPGDVRAERAALGEAAELIGGHTDDERPSATVHISLQSKEDADGQGSWFYNLEGEP